jgi:drug/metabolite transporter (DMT)-like permease
MKTSERVMIWTAFAIISTVWGTTWLAIRIGLETVPPFLSAGIRCLGAAAVLYALVRFRRLPVPMTQTAWKVYFSLGILTIAIPFALIYWGQQFIPTGLSSILFGAFPFWVALLSHFMLSNERMTITKAVAITLGFAGVVIIYYAETAIADPRAFLGMSAVVVSVILQALALVLIKKHGDPVSPMSMNFVGMTMGGTLLVLLSLVAEGGQPVTWTTPAVISLLYLTLVGSVITFVAYYWLLKKIDAVYVSLSSFINPIVAVVLGAVILGERMPPTVFTGAGLVMLGLLVANGKGIYARISKTQ